ncbi:MAG TPA: hypothetical protein VEH04_14205 [Verrucomicrobiae bacterium]|nr:hypothetical protein [Verrucomicrobiae bacterium]
MNHNLKKLLAGLAASAALTATSARAATMTVTADVAAGTTQTWYATNEYLLNTIVYVQTNATLIIEPGTVIRGGTNAANLIAKPGIPNLVSALWVTRGGKLYATGTPSAPIIFTMEGDDVTNPNDISPRVTGKWGGVVIMGRATINSAFDNTGNVANPVYDVYEGVTSPGPNFEHRFGGNDDADSSGALRYVSIRHTGSVFAPDRELNSLTMGGVGSGTVIEYVESFASSDDAFEWWGGNVSTRYLVAAFCEDDDFDTDQGYRGTNQFWFAIKPPWQGSVDSRGIESDGDTSQTIIGDRQPYSQWAVYNATLIGRGLGEIGFGGGSALNARDEAAPNVRNSVVSGFNRGILLDTDGLFHWTNATVRASAMNNVWNVTTASANANGNFLFSGAGFSNYVGDAALGVISYTNDIAALNPRPQSGSPALTNALAGAPFEVSYRGAFSGDSDTWADGWTALSTEGYLAPGTSAPGNMPPVFTAPAANSTVTVNVGANVSLAHIAADSDVPVQALTFELLSGPGSITPLGLFTWRPQVGTANTTNVIVVKVSDDGSPGLSATNSFNVVVNPLVLPTLAAPGFASGQFSLTIEGQTGPDYIVQSSTNLAAMDWVTVLSTNSPTLPFTYSAVSNDEEPMKFFRVLVGPAQP